MFAIGLTTLKKNIFLLIHNSYEKWEMRNEKWELRNDKYSKLIIYIYNTPLSYVTELCNLFKPSVLLVPIKIPLKVFPFAFNIAISFKE